MSHFPDGPQNLPTNNQPNEGKKVDQKEHPPKGILHVIGVTLQIVTIVIFLSIVFASMPSDGNFSILHQVPEGHVGVYWRGGALMKNITRPGFHYMMPLITRFEPIQITLKTDLVRDIPCGTNNGVTIFFDKIEVVNRLAEDYVYDTLLKYGEHYDKTWIHENIRHEINRFCSAKSLQEVYIDMFDQINEILKEAIERDCAKHAPGIEIISVWVTKPNIPATIERIFELMEEERIKGMIAIEKQMVAGNITELQNKIALFTAETHKKIALSEAETLKKIAFLEADTQKYKALLEVETQKNIALSEAEKEFQLSRILMEQKLMEKDSDKRQEAMENDKLVAREKAEADAICYRSMKETDAKKHKLTAFFQLPFKPIYNTVYSILSDKVQNKIKIPNRIDYLTNMNMK